MREPHKIVVIFSMFLCVLSENAALSQPPATELIDGSVDPSAISMGTAALAFFRTIDLEDERGQAEGFLRDRVGLDETSAAAFLAYVRSAVSEADIQTRASRDAFCQRRDQVTTREALAREVGDIDSARTDYLNGLLTGISSALDADSEAKVLSVISEQRSRMKVYKTDHQEFVTQTTASVAELIARMCDARPPNNSFSAPRVD